MINLLNQFAEFLQMTTPEAQGVQAAIIIGSAILGLLYCFFGYRSVRLITAIVGFLLGFVGGTAASVHLNLTSPLDIVVPVLAGVVVALLNFFLYKLGVFVAVFFVTMSVTASLLLTYVKLEENVALIIGLAAGLVFAILAVIFVKPVIIIMTAFMGGLLFADQIFEYLVQVRWDSQMETLARLGTGAGLGLIGMIFQFVTTRKKG